MSTAPLWFRKLKIREEGEFAMLPLYVRGLYDQIFKFCDDRGRFPLVGMTPAEAVALRCGAHRYERRTLERDINQLIGIGYLRHEGNVLIVVEQADDWRDWESMGASTRRRYMNDGGATEQRRSNDGATTGSLSSRNYSRPIRQQEERREEQKEKRRDQISPIGECEGGQAPPKTDPTPTLRKPNLDDVVGKGPEAWGMGGSTPSQSDHAKAQMPPTPRPGAPAPHVGRQEPFVPVVDPKPVRGQNPPAVGAGDRPATLVDLGPPAAARKPAKKSVAKRAAPKADEPQSLALPADWAPNEAHYAFGRELGLQKKHVDYFAGEMRDRAESDGMTSGNWNAKFRNWMRKGLEFRKGEPPIVPEPLPPKVPMPPAPPPPPEVLARAQVWKERMEAGEQIDLKSLFKPKFVVPPVENDFAEDCVG